MMLKPGATAIDLSLVSHTNVGKTSLLRTLVRRDIGEVADRAHVTEEAEGHILAETPRGDVLRVWDTPGFGDSARLLKRLRHAGNPIGWLLTQVWDRFTDRPFYCSQRAIRNVREESDAVLYLVNASEDPSAAAYVAAELQILRWIGKPVLLMLNQTGPARGPDAEARDEEGWSRALAEHVGAGSAITLDAFARCWVQEDRWLGAVGAILPADKHAGLERLRAAWRSRNLEVFDDAMETIAAHLAAAAVDRETVHEARESASAAAMNTLAKRLDQSVRASTDHLIALHGLSGRAKEEIPTRIAGQFEVSAPADVKKAGAIAGMLSGALGGLVADLSAGGLTFGAGAVIGGILGALGAGGAAHAYNVFRGEEEGRVRWSPVFLTQRAGTALLRYLAVAHYGRGRGDWVEGEYPPHWQALVAEVLATRRAALEAAWRLAEDGAGAADIAARLAPILREAAQEALARLYPGTEVIFASAAAASARLPG
jgi:hypothetical protein